MLTFADSYDTYSGSQFSAKYTQFNNASLGSPGRLGYGQYLQLTNGNGFTYRGLSTQTTVITGFASAVASGLIGNSSIFDFLDSSATLLGSVSLTGSGQIGYVSGGHSYFSSAGVISPNTWFYAECEVVLSSSATGSVTVRLNGVTVVSQASVITATNGNGCALLGPHNGGQAADMYYDDFYVLNASSPNNTFFGDTKILALMPAGNGRVNGWTRVGGSASGNWTAVDEIPPDGDASYVYTATPSTEDCYTITTLSNVATVLAIQLSAYARKDDTPSRAVALGVGNGSSESYGSGQSLNTTYTYILQPMDTNPLTSAPWAVADFATLQSAIELTS